MPTTAHELVDLVACLAPEQLHESSRVGRDEMHGERLALAGDAEGVVLLGDADEEARGLDAALRGETDQAAGALIRVRGGHDEHRVVERAGQLVEGLLHGSHATEAYVRGGIAGEAG